MQNNININKNNMNKNKSNKNNVNKNNFNKNNVNKNNLNKNNVNKNNLNKKEHSPLISKKTIELLQYRIQEEEMSARIYLSMSMWLENEGYVNATKLWKKYSSEENTHADWARDYLLSFGVLPETPELKKVKNSYVSFPSIIKKSFEHEIEITLQLKELANHAINTNDHMLYTLAEKYLQEQIEEHNKTQTLMDQLKSFGTNKLSMRLLNSEMRENIK
jgi:ferritin